MNNATPSGVGRFFDKDIRAVRPEMIGSGAALGIHAAIALHCAHMDVGLADFHLLREPLPAGTPVEEYFYASGESHSASCPAGVMELRLKKGASLCYDLTAGSRCFIGAYLYENAEGRRFLVFNLDGEDFLTGRRLELLHELERWLAGE